jgi:hypothetical protein
MCLVSEVSICVDVLEGKEIWMISQSVNKRRILVVKGRYHEEEIAYTLQPT